MQRGLHNLGNTCYLNSALQALRHAAPFADYFTETWKAHRHPERDGHDLAKAVADLLVDFKTPGTALNPRALVNAFFNVAKKRHLEDEFHAGVQADGTEAVLLILQVLHEQQARHVKMEITGVPKSPEHVEYIKSLESWTTYFHKEYSPIVEAFYGQTQTSLACPCGAKSSRYEPWGVLKLPIPNSNKQGAPAPTLQECIASYMASETIDDYLCEECKVRGKVRNEHHISRFPSHMILGLKRYTNAGAKVKARIPYNPDLIDFSEWITWPSIQTKTKYRVYAVIDQWGSSRGGHYNMRVRSPTDPSTWSLYDDTICKSATDGGTTQDTLMLFLERLP